MSTDALIRVGLIGLGGAGSGMTSRFARDPRYRVAAAADVDTELLARFQNDFPDAAAFTNAEGLCERNDVDLVYIGTPNRFHSEHARMASGNRKHVLIEKPMTLTLEDADEMIATAEHNGVLLGVNVKHSFEPRIQKLSEFARTGEHGQFRMLHHWRYADWLYRPRTPEELTPELGGGLVWRQGPHQFDIFRTIAGGLVRSIHGNVAVWDPARRVAGAYTAFVQFQDGAVGTAVYSGYDHYESSEMVLGPIDAPDAEFAEARREFRRHGESVEWETSAARAERYGGNRESSAGGAAARRAGANRPSGGGGWILHGPLIASFDHADVKLSAGGLLVFGDDGRWEIPMHEARDGIAGRLDTFYDAIVHDKPLAADGRWGKATLEVLLALEESSKTGGDVALKHQVPVAVQ
jgi:phthalate 4,5-cis-dihydrodiol dehydrogenase